VLSVILTSGSWKMPILSVARLPIDRTGTAELVEK